MAKVSTTKGATGNEPTLATAEVDPDHLTSPGQAVGTVAYMSPEQARAKDLDARTDLFSMGAVLYEMASGKIPFNGESTAVIFEAILNRTPASLLQLNHNIPSDLERIINKCLEKNRNLRYQHASDIKTDLQRLKRDTESQKLATALRLAPRRRKAPWIAGAFIFMVVGVLVGYLLFPHPNKLSEKDAIVLADFNNSTGDPVFDSTLKTALVVSLRQSPFLNVFPDNKVNQTLKLMQRPSDAKLTPDVAREVCQRARSKAYVDGTIGTLGSEYVLSLKAVNCQTGDTLAQKQGVASSRESVLNTLGETASKLREELGESLISVQKFDIPLSEATTSSLEALKAYSLGEKAFREKGPDATSLSTRP